MVITSLRNSEGEDFNIYLKEIIEATDQVSNTKPKDKLEKNWMYHTNAITAHLMCDNQKWLEIKFRLNTNLKTLTTTHTKLKGEPGNN
jgi:hypothetical protein